MNGKERNVGVAVKMPSQPCQNDKKCPFHGELRLHGRTFVGNVVRIRLQKNALVSFERRVLIPKYERYERRYTRIMCHNPLCLGVKENDKVKIMETRKLSKTKNFVIIEILNKN